MIRRLLCLFRPHRTYRERQLLHGVLVPHYVCSECGRAVPVLKRSAAEYREMAAAGRVIMPTAKPTQTPSAAERARVMETLTK